MMINKDKYIDEIFAEYIWSCFLFLLLQVFIDQLNAN